MKGLVTTAVALAMPYALIVGGIALTTKDTPVATAEVPHIVQTVQAAENRPVATPAPTPKAMTTKEVIEATADKYGIKREDLLAMAEIESGYNCQQIGDGGGSYGCFQINIKDSNINGRWHKAAHPDVSAEQAYDINYAAEWTAKRLNAKGYQENRKRAIRMHNGDPTIPMTERYFQKVDAVAKKLAK